ncbi:hypothetical protein OCUAc20_32950 [Acinetobacter baumannii]|nr:hypothetical protein OCUAc20_32950 [Acinetobacter baumannii]
MAIAEELHVKSLIQPYSNSIIQAIKEAWSLWLQSPFLENGVHADVPHSFGKL